MLSLLLRPHHTTHTIQTQVLCVSPQQSCVSETVNALNFARRCKAVVNTRLTAIVSCAATQAIENHNHDHPQHQSIAPGRPRAKDRAASAEFTGLRASASASTISAVGARKVPAMSLAAKGKENGSSMVMVPKPRGPKAALNLKQAQVHAQTTEMRQQYQIR